MKQIRTVSIVAIITIAIMCISIVAYFTIKDTSTSITIIHNHPATTVVTDTVEITKVSTHYEFDTLYVYPEWDLIINECIWDTNELNELKY